MLTRSPWRWLLLLAFTASAFLPGTIRNDDTRFEDQIQPPLPPPPLWGPATQGIQVSLMTFSHWQRLGNLGFHLTLRGLGASAVPTRQCQSRHPAHVASGRMVQSATATNRRCAPGQGQPPSGVVGTDVTTQEFGLTVNRSGMFEFDLIETLDGGQPLTLTSNRTSVVVTNN